MGSVVPRRDLITHVVATGRLLRLGVVRLRLGEGWALLNLGLSREWERERDGLVTMGESAVAYATACVRGTERPRRGAT